MFTLTVFIRWIFGFNSAFWIFCLFNPQLKKNALRMFVSNSIMQFFWIVYKYECTFVGNCCAIFQHQFAFHRWINLVFHRNFGNCTCSSWFVVVHTPFLSQFTWLVVISEIPRTSWAFSHNFSTNSNNDGFYSLLKHF